MMKITDGCIGCCCCQGTCMFDAITLTSEGVCEIDPEKCQECGQCAANCPMGVIVQE